VGEAQQEAGNAQMNLQEMGDLLRQERERRGLSIDEVVQKTRISREIGRAHV